MTRVCFRSGGLHLRLQFPVHGDRRGAVFLRHQPLPLTGNSAQQDYGYHHRRRHRRHRGRSFHRGGAVARCLHL